MTVGCDLASRAIRCAVLVTILFCSAVFAAPQVIDQSRTVSVLQGQTARFTVSATGTAPLIYQWQRSDDGGETFGLVAGATTDSYELTNAVLVDNGAQFLVTVLDATGETTDSSVIVLTVECADAAPRIERQPRSRTAVIGTAAEFRVFASGTSLVYQWQRSDDGGETFRDIPGATSDGYTLFDVSDAEAGDQFAVRVFNTAGSVTSFPAVLSVRTVLPATGPRIVAGPGFSLARLSSGQVLSWGSDFLGALGNGERRYDVSAPQPVLGLSDVVEISGDGPHVLAIRANGEVWSWGVMSPGGDNIYHPDDAVHTPRTIPGVNGATAVCAGSELSLFLMPGGLVLAMGSNVYGQLGNGTGEDSWDVPVQVQGLTGVTAVSCNLGHALALMADGTVRAWGSNSYGQLGDGMEFPRNSDVPVVVSGLSDVIAIAAGAGYSLALRSDGSIWSWGDGAHGRLGDGPRIGKPRSRHAPGPTSAPGIYTAISAGSCALALRDDGTVWAWGSNYDGECGNGGDDPPIFHDPQRIDRLSDVVEITATNSHGLAVLSDGTLVAWGNNHHGQLGIGSSGWTELPRAPVRIGSPRPLNLN
jgi:alpha-tubulin suppressor-like RCC1 family protein